MSEKEPEPQGSKSRSSRIKEFFKLSNEDRLNKVKEFADLSDEEVELMKESLNILDKNQLYFIENVIGAMHLPMGIATNFRVNGKEYLVPFATEEASVVAAASNSAKVALAHGGFFASNSGPIMIGQIQCVNVPDPFGAKLRILEKRDEIIQKANEQDPILVKFGGGCEDIRVRVVDSLSGPMVITELLVNCGDAMGANAVNTMAEACAPLVEKHAGGRVFLRIISNLADKRIVRARAVFAKRDLATESMSGDDVVDGILDAYAFAEADPYRAATHNKGIMNAISAITVATANDWRAIEAGAHSYAARSGVYTSLTTYEKNLRGDLVGTIELPLALGLVGGATRIHPLAKVAVKILGVKTAVELGEVIASAGLAQNFGAMRALATTGIQSGHMRLHARNMALDVIKQDSGDLSLADKIVEKISSEKGKVTMDRVKSVYEELKS
ncbi:MAG: hydroxymethylglutaryl-CoA reductase, degradative [Candidatus Hodarchaeales archaeon]|jgi:hydroxymethylglutaryl-CoA reductase